MFLAEVQRSNNEVLKVLINKLQGVPTWAKDSESSFWVETTNLNPDKRFAAVGDTYLSDLDNFVEPQPFESWILSEDTVSWEPPVPHPDPDPFVAHLYEWDEESVSWHFYGDKSNTKDGY